MNPLPAASDGSPAASRAVVWLRVVKLLLSIVLLALGIFQALGRLGH